VQQVTLPLTPTHFYTTPTTTLPPALQGLGLLSKSPEELQVLEHIMKVRARV
jgi:hypothetical protein